MTTSAETISIQYWKYLSDRPVGLKDNILWQVTTTINEEISQIAESIVSPLLHPESPVLSSSITFAIHGRWGMGKSSALRMIKEKAIELAKEKGIDAQLKFCDYIATIYESHSYDARITMALRILSAIAGGPRQALEKYLQDTVAVEAFDALAKEQKESLTTGKAAFERPSGEAAALERVAIALSRLVDFDQIIKKALKEEDGKDSVLVVLIDDLDRCKPDFIRRVLDSIQQLSDIDNLFFVLAVEREHLHEAVEKQTQFERNGGEVSPDFALEKYIQHSVSVPDMDKNSLKIFVEQLMKEYIGKDLVSDAIVSNVLFLQNGLRVLTPRSVKRCLNTIRPDLKRRLKAGMPSEEQHKVVKERLLEYVWPDFYHRYFLPAISPEIRQRVRSALIALEAACREFSVTNDEARFVFDLKRISDRFDLAWESSIDKDLAKYLGMRPFFFIEVSQEEKDQYTPYNLYGILEGLPVEKKSKTDELLPVTEGRDLEEEFLKLYLQSEAAEARDDARESLQAAAGAYNLIMNNRDYFSARHAPSIGNIAINAEKFRALDLATRLYELALELDPEHSNNIQNYADFIIKAHIPNLFPRAEQLLAKLKTGKHAQHRPDRTLALEAKLSNLMGRTAEVIDHSVVERVVNEFLTDSTGQQKYSQVMSFLVEFNEFEAMRQITQAFYQHTAEQNDRYFAIRGLADMLADSPDEANELEAMEMYRYILTHLVGQKAEENRPDTEYNYAVLLYKHDYDDEAGKMWFEAYKKKLQDPNIRRAYGLYLQRAGRPDLASAVLDGEPIEEMVLQRAQKQLPEHFREDIDRWWEK